MKKFFTFFAAIAIAVAMQAQNTLELVCTNMKTQQDATEGKLFLIGLADDMTWGLCVVTDIKTRAWYIHLHIYPLTTQTTEQEVDNENILANTQFMLSAP